MVAPVELTTGARFVHDSLELLGWDVEIVTPPRELRAIARRLSLHNHRRSASRISTTDASRYPMPLLQSALEVGNEQTVRSTGAGDPEVSQDWRPGGPINEADDRLLPVGKAVPLRRLPSTSRLCRLGAPS